MKSIVYIGVFLLLRLTKCRALSDEYDLFEPIKNSDTDTETIGADDFPAWLLDQEHHMKVPISAIGITKNIIPLPFALNLIFKLEESRRTCLFSIVDSKGSTKLALCMYLANQDSTRIALYSDIIKNEEATFTITFLRNNWTNMTLYVEETHVSLTVNCSDSQMSPEFNLLQAIEIGNDSTLHLGYSGTESSWHPFKGVVQQIKLMTNVDESDIEGLCKTDELPSSFFSESPPPPISPPPEPVSCECSNNMVSQILESMTNLRGPPGKDGKPGPFGPQGVRGDKGDQGEQGKIGPKGDTGEKGDIGRQGDKGESGQPGKDGAPGLQGPPGPPGPVVEQVKADEVIIPGEKGDTGPRGPEGPEGPKGLDGIKGEKGLQGIKGEKGDQGIQGVVGPRGERGDRGDMGETGPAGQYGDKGDKGERGDQGLPGTPGQPAKLSSLLDPETDPAVVEAIVEKLRGLKGEPGNTGNKGTKGEQGPEGPTMVQVRPEKPIEVKPVKGEKGQSGVNGKPGAHGPIGPTGKQGPKGPPGPRGAKGETGSHGPIGPPGPRGDRGHPGEKGVKGDCTTPDLAKIKGEKGAKGDVGLKGESGQPGPPGPKAENNYVPVPGPPGPPGPAGLPGVSIVGPKGEPGGFASVETMYSITHGKRSPNDVHSDDDEGHTSGTVIYKTTTALLKKTSDTPIGTLAYVIREKMLLLRVDDGWQYVVLGSILETRDPDVYNNINRPPTLIPSPPPTLNRPSIARKKANLEKGYIRLVALNSPYAGNMVSVDQTGTLAANNQCHSKSRKVGGTFLAFLASRDQDLRSLVKHTDRHLPVVNLHHDVIFHSWNSLFDGGEGPLDISRAPIYSFSGRNILIDPIWPEKVIWHGSNPKGTHSSTDCGGWRLGDRDQFGLASSFSNYKLLGQEMYSCDKQLIVLCVEVTASVSRGRSIRDPRRHAPSKRRAYNMHHHHHSHSGVNNVTFTAWNIDKS